MKNKIYFLISSAVQMVMFVFTIMNSSKLAKAMTEFNKFYPEGMRERIDSLFSDGGRNYIIFLAILGFLLNGLIIYLVMNDKLLKKRGSVVVCSSISFFFSMYPLGQLFAILNIIVIMATKRVRPEDFPDKKEKLPILEKEKVDNKKIIKAIILLLVYFSQFIWGDVVSKGPIKNVLSIVFYILMIVLSILFFKDLLRNNFREFRKNFKAYMQNLLPIIGKYYLIYFVIAIVSAILAKQGTSVNQTKIEELPILLSLPLAIIYAPIVEETLFRGCIRRFIKSDKVFLVVSAITFGLLHTAFSEASIYNVIVVALPYAAMGYFLAYLYTKTNNICTNIAFHAFQNTMAMILTIIIKGLFLI